MKISIEEIKDLIKVLGYKEDEYDYWTKTYSDKSTIAINFEKENIEYDEEIKLGDKTTSNFLNSENFVVLECVDRLLEKGYKANRLHLEYKWSLGRQNKGKLDILVKDDNDKTYLMIECKTYGEEYDKEIGRMLDKNGGQLFSYFQQDRNAKFLCLYTSKLDEKQVRYENKIVEIKDVFRSLNEVKEIHQRWNKQFDEKGIFEKDILPYQAKVTSKYKKDLKELQEGDANRIYNEFLEILRHNVVSDKANAFNKIFNLFLCKVWDEGKKKDHMLLDFQWFNEKDDFISFLSRLNVLYKGGMKDFLKKEITDYTEEQISLLNVGKEEKQVQRILTELRLYKNNEFAFIEVYNERSFEENARIVKEVVQLLENWQIRYTHKQQFLGEFFEKLLNSGFKQESGQFFTPTPLARFIVKSIPIKEILNKKVDNDEKDNLLPHIIDFACGSGHFLTEAMDVINEYVKEIDTSNLSQDVDDRITDYKDPKKQFIWAKDYIYGIEKDYRLVKTSKVSCFLNGDGEANIIHDDGLNSFGSEHYFGKLETKTKEDDRENREFDILIANPPYSVEGFRNNIKKGHNDFELFKNISDSSKNIEVLFIERMKQLLKDGGYAGIILPSSILSNGDNYSRARKLMLKYFEFKAVVSLGNNAFMATGTNTVILFLKRRTNSYHKEVWNKVEKFFNEFEDDEQGTFSSYTKKAFDKPKTIKEYEEYIENERDEAIKRIVDLSKSDDPMTAFFGKKEIEKLQELMEDLSDESDMKMNKMLDKWISHFIDREKEKLFIYALTHGQKIIIVKSGEKEKEKDFLGYEFSNRRGHEGMHKRGDGLLYDENSERAENKANHYIYGSMLDENINEVNEELKDHLFIQDFADCFDWERNDFDSQINLMKKNKTLESEYTKYKSNKLKELLTTLESGNRPKGGVSYYKDGAFSIGGEHIGMDGRITTNNEKFVPMDFYNLSNRGKVKIDDILICKDGDLKVGLYRNDISIKNVMINEHVFLLRTVKNISQVYLFHLLCSSVGKEDLKNRFKGSIIPGLNRENLNNIKIPLPPIDVQERIVAEIGEVESIEEQAKATITTKQQEIEQIILSINEKEELLKDIAELVRGPFGGSLKKEIFVKVGYKVYEQKNCIKNNLSIGDYYITEEKFNEMERFSIKENDILMSCSGTIGKTVIIPKIFKKGIINQALLKISPKTNKVIPIYLQYIINMRFNYNKHGLALENIESVSNIKNYKIPLPSLDVQKDMVALIDVLEKDIENARQVLVDAPGQKKVILEKHLK